MLDKLFWNKATFVEKRFESDNVYTFVFKPEKAMSWLPGQFVDFKLPSGQVKHFTIASAPYGGNIHLTTRIFDVPSDYKQELLKLKPGSLIQLGKPQGELTVDDKHSDYIFIAGGIGITPFRSILWDLSHHNSGFKVTLFYAYSSEQPPFKDEITKIASLNPNMSVKFFLNNTPITESDIKFEPTENTEYLISGPPKMVEVYEKMLKGMGTGRKNIKSDSFWGY